MVGSAGAFFAALNAAHRLDVVPGGATYCNPVKPRAAMNLPLAATFLFLAAPAFAQELASGEDILTAISGNTVEGSMAASGSYAEFYEAGGQIRGKGFAGSWMISGDQMCFAYGSDPASCWNARITGDQVTWINDGVEEGTGTILKGNPNGF